MAADFHTHILPGIDDGSASLEESLEMLRLLHAQGIRRVVATPHFYANHDTPQRFLSRRQAAVEKLMAALDPAQSPELYIGAEVHYFEGISDSEALEDLAIARTGHILVEMPHSHWTHRMFGELRGISQKRGLTPVIAHIDRYISPFRTNGIPERLTELPVLIQANSEFFLRRTTRPMALRMLRDGQIHLLGSDCHDLVKRKPDLGEALAVIRRKLGQETLDSLARLEDQLLDP